MQYSKSVGGVAVGEIFSPMEELERGALGGQQPQRKGVCACLDGKCSHAEQDKDLADVGQKTEKQNLDVINTLSPT